MMRISQSIVALSLFSIKSFYSGRVISYLALMFFILDRLFRISYDDSFSFTYRHHSKWLRHSSVKCRLERIRDYNTIVMVIYKITVWLPIGLLLLCRRPVQKIFNYPRFHYPSTLSQNHRIAHPLALYWLETQVELNQLTIQNPEIFRISKRYEPMT